MDNATSDSCSGLSRLEKLNTAFLRASPNIPGLIGVIAFYVLILLLGILGSWWGKKKNKHLNNTESEEVMLAGRNIGLFVGIFTMTATWVGGGYINGTAESLFTPEYGLVQTQAPFCYAISLCLGGVLFARRMRQAGYVTMLDPFDQRYGKVMAALLYVPALLGDIFWSSAIFSALGGSLSVIVGLNHMWAVIISASIAILYTFIGGLYSVSYTDVIQLICIFVGLWLVVPFALLHPAVTSIAQTVKGESSWLGKWPSGPSIGSYIDSALLLIFGGIPWQAYFQRVLSQRTGQRAMVLSIAAGFGCLIMAIPPGIIGAIAASTDWNATAYRDFGQIPVPACDYPLALPMVMQFLTPLPVAVIGLGAVSAAVMSSADSSILSSSSMFARNVYQPLRDGLVANCCNGQKASEREVVWVLRLSVIIIGAVAILMGIAIQSLYGLWYLCSDLVYIILFPQLLCVVHLPFANAYGSLAGYIVGWILRFLGGEPMLNLDATIRYPWFDHSSGYQTFPHKTLAMLTSLLSIVLFSWIFSGCCRSMPGVDSKLFGVWTKKSISADTTLSADGLGRVNEAYRKESKDTDSLQQSSKL